MKKIAAEKNYRMLKEAGTFSLGDLDRRVAELDEQSKLNTEQIAKTKHVIEQLVARVSFLSDKKKQGQ